jgi:hypothetical protein
MDYKVNTKKLNKMVKDTTRVLCLLLCLVVFIPKDIHTQETPYLDWVKTYGSNISGGIDGGGATNLKVGKSNDFYVLGGFVGSVNLGDGEPEADFITGTGTGDVAWFIVKYDSLGNFQWGNTILGGTYFKITGFELDEEDNIYIAGSLSNPTDFHFDENEEFILTPSQGNNSSNRRTPFIAKYDNSGNLIWGHTLDVSFHTDILDLIYSSDQNSIYISGLLQDGFLDLDPSNENYLILSDTNFLVASAYIAKYNTDGVFLNGHHFHVNTLFTGTTISMNSNSSGVYLNGNFSDSIYLDKDSLIGPVLPYSNNSNHDMYLVKFDHQLKYLWHSTHTSEIHLAVNKICSSDENTYIIHHYRDTISYYPISQNNIVSYYDDNGIIITNYSKDGFIVWQNKIACKNSTYCQTNRINLQLDKNNNLLVTGWFSGSMDFDPDPNQEYILTSSMSSSGTFHIRDIFVAKYTPEGELMWAFNLSCDYNINTVGGLDFSHGNFPIIAGSFVGNHNFSPHFNEPHYIQASNSLNGDMFIAKYNFEVEEEIIDIQSIQLFPNPSTDKHKIELKGYSKQSLKVNLYDIQGRLLGNVYDGIIDGQHQILEFDVSRLSSGVYLYDVRLESERKALRFIKQ